MTRFQLLREIDALGWKHIESLSPSPCGQTMTIALRHTDGKGRPHSLGLTLAAEHPHAPPLRVDVRLPGGAAFEVVCVVKGCRELCASWSCLCCF